jgi:hypothetical protein
MIKDALRFLWRRDSESATILVIDLGQYLNDTDLVWAVHHYRGLIALAVHQIHVPHRQESQQSRIIADIIWFGLQSTSVAAVMLAESLASYMTLKDMGQMGDYYAALVESRERK